MQVLENIDNKQLKDFCIKAKITENQFFGLEPVDGSLNLNGLTSIPEGFNPTVGRSLFLNGLKSIPEWFNPTIGGGLFLDGLKSIHDGFNPTVGGGLYLSGLTSIPDNFNPTVGAGLFLNGLTSIPDSFNPTVGGDLFLGSLTSIPDNFNPTVGGNLYLRSLISIPDSFNPTVGGDLFLGSLTNSSIAINRLVNASITWENGKYIKADGIFTEVISKKKNVYKVKHLTKTDTFFLVTDGNDKWSHGKTIQDAKKDLIYKIGNRDTSIYDSLTFDSVLSFEEAIECYRVITGACFFGTRDFIEREFKNKKSVYTISEIIKITEGRYGNNVFHDFFKD